jgi:hypothetical protein
MNSSIYNQTIIFTGIRQLEFAIVQLQREIQNFMMGLEGIFFGKLPITLIPPTTLSSILRNVSLLLPEGYTLLAGLKQNDVYLYYEHSKVLVYANHHTLRVIIDVPLKSFDRYY